jgi:hypothetical protein
VIDAVLCDEALVHHVEEAFCKDPSRTLQLVYLTLPFFEKDSRRQDPVYFSKPRAVTKSQVCKALIHIDAIKDLLFYHYPREDLVADGKVP